MAGPLSPGSRRPRRSRFITCVVLFLAAMAAHAGIAVIFGMSGGSSRPQRTRGFSRGGIPLPLIEDIDPGLLGWVEPDDETAGAIASLSLAALSDEVEAVMAQVAGLLTGGGDLPAGAAADGGSGSGAEAGGIADRERRHEAAAAAGTAEAAAAAATGLVAGMEGPAALDLYAGDGGSNSSIRGTNSWGYNSSFEGSNSSVDGSNSSLGRTNSSRPPRQQGIPDAAQVAALRALAAALLSSCRDHPPFPCLEVGCPAAAVGCDVMAWSCGREFQFMFEQLPNQAMEGMHVHELCPLTCNRCGPGALLREQVLAGQMQLGAGGAGWVGGPGTARGGEDGLGSSLNLLDECNPGRDGANSGDLANSGDGSNSSAGSHSSAGSNSSAGFNSSAACRGGRGVWGAIWDSKPPIGEDSRYRPPATVLGYSKMTDATSWTRLEKKDEKGCLRYFKVGDRGDMRGTVRPMLKQLGMCDVPPAGRTDFTWTRPWMELGAFFRPKQIEPGSIVNSIAGLVQQVGEKMSLARLHVKCMQRAGYEPLDALPSNGHFCRFTSRAFAVRKNGAKLQTPYRRFREYNLQLDDETMEEHRIWILKPQGGFNQVGIHMFSLTRADTFTPSATAAWLMQRVPEGTWVLQEYLMNPMTYRGHKFDLRIWALVTSLDPLRIYLLGTGIPKVSQWNYSKAVHDVKQMCIHVLMPGGSACFNDHRAEVLSPYPTRTNVQDWYDNVYPPGELFWTTVAWPSLEWQIVEMLLLARDNILHIDHQIKRHGIRYKRIFFLSPDFVIGTDGQATMVEVNVNGYMIGNLHKRFFPLHEEQRSVFRLLGANGFPKKQKYVAALEERTAAFCKRRRAGCTPAAEREIWEMVHEDMHCANAWYRIFPANDSHAYTSRLRSSPAYSRSFTYMDYTMLDWLADGWAPRHTLDENGTVVVKKTLSTAQRADENRTAALKKAAAAALRAAENRTGVVKKKQNSTGVFKKKENSTGVFKKKAAGRQDENRTGVLKKKAAQRPDENRTTSFKKKSAERQDENRTGAVKKKAGVGKAGVRKAVRKAWEKDESEEAEETWAKGGGGGREGGARGKGGVEGGVGGEGGASEGGGPGGDSEEAAEEAEEAAAAAKKKKKKGKKRPAVADGVGPASPENKTASGGEGGGA